MWTRGLRHCNPTVRQATLEALCGREWGTQHALRLTPHFVCEVLLPCAMGLAKLGPSGSGGDTNGTDVSAADATAATAKATLTAAMTAAGVGEAAARLCGAWVQALGTQDPGRAFDAVLAIATAVADKSAAASLAGLDTGRD
jgi:hypothetical protein